MTQLTSLLLTDFNRTMTPVPVELRLGEFDVGLEGVIRRTPER